LRDYSKERKINIQSYLKTPIKITPYDVKTKLTKKREDLYCRNLMNYTGRKKRQINSISMARLPRGFNIQKYMKSKPKTFREGCTNRLSICCSLNPFDY